MAAEGLSKLGGMPETPALKVEQGSRPDAGVDFNTGLADSLNAKLNKDPVIVHTSIKDVANLPVPAGFTEEPLKQVDTPTLKVQADGAPVGKPMVSVESNTSKNTNFTEIKTTDTTLHATAAEVEGNIQAQQTEKPGTPADVQSTHTESTKAADLRAQFDNDPKIKAVIGSINAVTTRRLESQSNSGLAAGWDATGSIVAAQEWDSYLFNPENRTHAEQYRGLNPDLDAALNRAKARDEAAQVAKEQNGTKVKEDVAFISTEAPRPKIPSEDERIQKMDAYKAKLAKGEMITAAENEEYHKFVQGEVTDKRIAELKDQLIAGDEDPRILAEYNKLIAERNGEPIPRTEAEKVQDEMQTVLNRVAEQGDATPNDWADMAQLYQRGVGLNVDTSNLRQEAARRLMETIKDPNKMLKMKELMATKEIQDMIQEVTSLALQNRNLPRIQKERIEAAKAQTKKVAELKKAIKNLPDAAENDPQILAYNQERSVLASLNNDVVQLKYAYKANQSRIKYLNLMIDVKLGTVSGTEAFMGCVVYGIESFSSQAIAEMDALTNGTAQHEQVAIAA